VIYTVDFETEPIDDGSPHAPEPVGVAIKPWGGPAKYWAWGHPTGNNCTREQGVARLKDVWHKATKLLFHNSIFDVSVAVQHCGMFLPAWQDIEDTLFLLYLNNPHSLSLSLKPAAQELLGEPPTERDAVNEWLLAHGHIKSLKQKDAGAYICMAPGDVVGPYACGDVNRTEGLHRLLHPHIIELGMGEAYDRERRLMPILLRNQTEGMRVDIGALEQDVTVYQNALERADEWLRNRLGAPYMNLDSDEEVAAALDVNDIITQWTYTKKTGKKSTSKKNLTIDKFNDQEVAQALGYRNRLQTVLSMSMVPWLEQASRYGGQIYTKWNQTRQSNEGHGANSFKGTRTGRLSCSRFQNITKSFADRGDGYEHPRFLKVPELPLVRRYIVADKGENFGHRDYNQQEFRILSHFEDGRMCAQYRQTPRMDFHTTAQQMIERMLGKKFERRVVKTIDFGMLYGEGAGSLAGKLNVPVEDVRAFFRALRAAIPDLKTLEYDIRVRCANNEPIRTWGGRLYYCEPPKYVEKFKRVMSFEYKMLNYLIQGSAADCTKEAVIRYDEHPKRRGRFLVTVHDEINFSAAPKLMAHEQGVLNECMSSVDFSVPMISDGKHGRSWGELEKFEEAE